MIAYPLKFLNKEEEKFALTLLSMLVPFVLGYLIYLKQSDYSKGIKHLCAINTHPFPVPETPLSIKGPQDAKILEQLQKFHEEKAKLATLYGPSKEHLYSILHRLNHLGKAQKALGLKEQQAFYYLKLNKNLSQDTFDRYLKALEESTCQCPILVLENPSPDDDSPELVDTLIKKIQKNPECEQVKILVLNNTKDEILDKTLTSFNSAIPLISYEVQESLEQITLHNLQQFLSDKQYFSIDLDAEETVQALKELHEAALKPSNSYGISFKTQNILVKIAESYEKTYLNAVVFSEPSTQKEYLKWMDLQKKVDRLKKQQDGVTVSMSSYFENISLENKEKAFSLMERDDFKQLLSDFLILELAVNNLSKTCKKQREHLQKLLQNKDASKACKASFSQYCKEKRFKV